MAVILLIITVVGFYFMLAPQDANMRTGVSLRNQNKFLIFMFALFGAQNLVRLISAISLGATGAGTIALVFLILDIVIVNMYLKRL